MRLIWNGLFCVNLVLFGAGAVTKGTSNEHLALANQLRATGDVGLAEREFTEAVRAGEAEGPQSHAQALDDACPFYAEIGKFNLAGPCLRRSLEIWQKILGPDHIALNRVVSRLASLYIETGQFAQAERLGLERWLERAATADPSSDDYLNLLGTVAAFEVVRGHYAEAEDLNRKALGILEQRGQLETMNGVVMLNNLGMSQFRSGRYERAHDYFLRAAQIGDRISSDNGLDRIATYTNLAFTDRKLGKRQEAEQAIDHAIQIAERYCGPDSPRLASLLMSRAIILRDQKRKAEASQLEKRAKVILGASTMGVYTSSIVDIGDLRRQAN